MSHASDVSMAETDRRGKPRRNIDYRRALLISLGLGLFALAFFGPRLGPAIDPQGKAFPLTAQGQGAIAVFLLAVVWWVTEVVPIGVTGIAIGVVQVLFGVRKPDDAFRDFMDPSVWFIIGSLVFGAVFTKTGLTRRLAYKMLTVVGEKTSMIYLGCFAMTLGLTLVMAHTAVAATVFPLFLAIHSLYSDSDEPTRFGKGLFIGMAFVAGAGSVITLLGAARGAVAIGFFAQMTGKSIGFFELSYYLAPVGVLMLFLIWGFVMVRFKPEKPTIEGLRERARKLHEQLGPMGQQEWLALVVVLAVIVLLGARALFPQVAWLKALDKSAVILTGTLIFYVFKVLVLEDLEQMPWNIVLLFGGAMSIGFCLWQTGAAQWLAIKWLTLFKDGHWFVFILGIAFFVLVMTNLIMNVAAIAISLPVALVIAPYMHVSPEVILYASLVTAGMPFLLLVGAAPNAIAYTSDQFTTKEFFTAGLVPSAVVLAVVGLFVVAIWPLMGMPVTVP